MNEIINGTATDYEMPATNYVGETDYIPNSTGYDKHDYAESKGRNQEFYPDPTHVEVRRRMDDNGYPKRYQNHRRSGGIPAYYSTKSKRHELIGVITRICEIAGFELAERIVLRDKTTGEVLK